MSDSYTSFPLLVGWPGTERETRYSFKSISRTDTQRRPRPSNLFLNSTAVFTSTAERSDAAIFWPNGSSSSLVETVGSLGFGGFTNTEPEELIELRLRNRLRAQFKGSTLDLATQLGEYREAAVLFPDLTKDLLGILRTLKGKDPKRLRRWMRHPWRTISQGASSAWLVTAYGIRPTLGFMSDAAEALRSGAPYSPRPTRVRSSDTQRFQEVHLADDVLTSSVGYKQMRLIGQCEVSFDLLNGLLSRMGLTNPLALAWELTTLSFVLDWWIDVGGFLAGLDNSLSFSAPIYIRSIRSDYYRTVSAYGATGTYRQRETSRSAIQGMDVTNELEWGSGLHGQRIASALALTYQFRNAIFRKN